MGGALLDIAFDYISSVILIDTHAHLCAAEFSEDLPRVLERARAAGVGRIVAVGETLGDARRNLELAKEHPSLVAPACGLFPTRLDLEEAMRLAELIRDHRDQVIAIGEVGLDYWRIQEPDERALQRRIFGAFVELAIELDLPLNVHSRSAGHHAIEFLMAAGARRVQLHAFDGKASRARAGVEAGYFFSVPPSVVRSPQKQKLIRQLPLSCLLLETDSPVLGADPGERNEPANLGVPLQAIARLKSESEATITEAVYENSVRLYGPRLVSAPHVARSLPHESP